jgi:hypothetical protein
MTGQIFFIHIPHMVGLRSPEISVMARNRDCEEKSLAHP